MGKRTEIDRLEAVVNSAASLVDDCGVPVDSAMTLAAVEDRFIYGSPSGSTPRGILQVETPADRKREALLSSLTLAVGRRLRFR